ncbi:uncharacterized protein DDB_G0284311-like [Hibiscus syriacus]|uniref:uncharacterized protein DDB_G0284311-like n=1 Tax=Hibiscus syriacus TaxID=106335 RepID=UPI001922F4DB|nr:uncharacterized protein DDB_G0284311-like [Hibiscus syriacus]
MIIGGLFREYLGSCPPSFNGGRITLGWLKSEFKELCENYSKDEAKAFAWHIYYNLLEFSISGGIVSHTHLRSLFYRGHISIFNPYRDNVVESDDDDEKEEDEEEDENNDDDEEEDDDDEDKDDEE